MMKKKSKLVVVGDRILIEPDEGEEKTAVGLYVPRWVVEKESVQGGPRYRYRPRHAVSGF